MQAQPSDEILEAAGKYNNEGVQLASQGRFREAIRAFRQAIALVPRFASAYFNMGRAHSQLKQYDAAVRAFGTAVQVQPDYADAWYQLGIAFQMQGQFDEARKAYETLAPLVSESPHLLYRLGYTSLQLKDWDKTAEYWDRLRDAYPEHPAVGQIQKYMPQVYFNLGTVQYQNGELKKAEGAFDRAMRSQPGYAEAHYNAGLVFRDQKRYAEALDMMREAEKLNYNVVQTRSNIAGIYTLLDSIDQAVKVYESLLIDAPDDLSPYRGLVHMMIGKGKLAHALAYGITAAANLPGAESLRLLAYVYEHNGHGERYGIGFDAGQAIEVYKRVLVIAPKDVSAHYNLGVLYGRLGNWEAALKAMRRAGELDPEHAGVKKWLPEVKKR